MSFVMLLKSGRACSAIGDRDLYLVYLVQY